MNISPLDAWIRAKINPAKAVAAAGPLRPALEAWQLARLNETLALARARSPFYRRLHAGLPETLHSLQELQDFSFTTPEELRHNPLQLVCVSQDEIQRVVTLQSSGTTGEPKRLYFTADDQELTIDFFGVGMSTLTWSGERVLILLPGQTPGSVGDLLRMGLLRQGREPVPFGPVRDPLAALEAIDAHRIDCLVGSPTQVLGLARRWQPGRRMPRTVLLSTDYVPRSIVKVIEETWGCEVFNHYGATEMGLGGGVECEAHAGYHLREADLYFEIIDPATGRLLPAGEYGEVVVTTLTRRGMPLIRYRMGDRSRYLPGSCACGAALLRMEPVSGRFAGIIPIGESRLYLPDFDEALFPIPGLLNFSLTLGQNDSRTFLRVDVHLLNSAGARSVVEQALSALPAIQAVDVLIEVHQSPQEAGSILKRVITDQRGEYA